MSLQPGKALREKIRHYKTPSADDGAFMLMVLLMFVPLSMLMLMLMLMSISMPMSMLMLKPVEVLVVGIVPRANLVAIRVERGEEVDLSCPIQSKPLIQKWPYTAHRT